MDFNSFSQVPGEPLVHLLCSSTPVGQWHQVYKVPLYCSRPGKNESSNEKGFRGSITQLLHLLPTLHTRNRFLICKTRFRLLTRLYRAGHFLPARFLLKVSAHRHSPLPDLSWRNTSPLGRETNRVGERPRVSSRNQNKVENYGGGHPLGRKKVKLGGNLLLHISYYTYKMK